MKLKDLVQSISSAEKWSAEADGAAFTITVAISAKRSQKVVVTEFKDQGTAHVRFTSRVGPASSLDAARCRAALELNARLPHGSLALADGQLVLTETRPLETTTPATSGAAIRFIARQADLYEETIYGTDVH